MTLQSIMQSKGLSKYRLSKESGIPWATLADICSGKTRLDRCSAGTLVKLAGSLEITVEELLHFKIAQAAQKDGKPKERGYLETGLPPDLEKAIADYIQGEKAHSSVLDCLWGELYGSINAHYWGGGITEEQAKHLRAKYLFDEGEEES